MPEPEVAHSDAPPGSLARLTDALRPKALQLAEYAVAVARARAPSAGKVVKVTGTDVVLAALRRPEQPGSTKALWDAVPGDERQQRIDEAIRVTGAVGEIRPPARTPLALLGMHRVLRDAAKLAETTGRKETWAHHLAAVGLRGTLDPEVLSALGVSRDDLRAALLAAVIDKWSKEESPEIWAEELGPKVVLGLRNNSDLVDATSGIDAKNDALDLSTYSTMLASLIAREDTKLPLSIGLFGAWGSGKSFFMGLLQHEVRRLQETRGHHADIAHITFNAWSYADANLWASLGDDIFAGLAKHGTLDKTPQQRLEALQGQLASTKGRALELEAARDQAGAEAVRFRREAQIARTKRDRSAKALLKATAEVVGSELQTDNELTRAMKRLGVADATEQGLLLRDAIHGVGDNARILRSAVTGRPRRRIAAVLLVGVLLAGVLLLAMTPSIGSDKGDILVPGLGAVAVAVGLAATAAGRIHSGLRNLTRIAGKVQKAHEDLVTPEMRTALTEFSVAEARVEYAQAELDQVLDRVGELGRAIAELAPDQRLYSFLAERAMSDDYRGQLSLVSTVRRDLKNLSDLLTSIAEGPAEADGRRARPANPALPSVDRIVLYIDDLDRCTPRRVVEVLQAVHLLLASPLFVVVVGVDPRWLVRSLSDQYNTILREPPRAASSPDTECSGHSADVWRSTPHDYMEKIFNIPFVLPSFTGVGFGAMVKRLGPTGAGMSDGDGETPVVVDGFGGGAITDPQPERPDGRDIVIPVESVPDPPEPPEIDLTPLQDYEEKFLSALGPLVPSPRAATRLLNLYRMFRSNRGISTVSKFLGGPEGRRGEYQAVALLLGLQAAEPMRLAQILEFMRWLDEDGGKHDRSPTWQDVVDGLHPRGHWYNDLAAELTEAERDSWVALVERLKGVTLLVDLPDLKGLLKWGSHVAQFSFHLHSDQA